jgi:hypothetical protein
LEEDFPKTLAASTLSSKLSLLGDKIRFDADFMKSLSFTPYVNLEIRDEIKSGLWPKSTAPFNTESPESSGTITLCDGKAFFTKYSRHPPCQVNYLYLGIKFALMLTL